MRGALQNQLERPKILIMYVAVHPTAVSENYSSLRVQQQKITDSL